jgi:N-methylhydantoinase B/oxoprolinase/acetone carboxylase alpha subunit
MRAVIGRIPDGTYEFEDHVDDDGISDTPIRIHARLTVEGDGLTVDLSGCSPQVMGPSNATLSSTYSTVFYALIASADVPVAPRASVTQVVVASVPFLENRAQSACVTRPTRRSASAFPK